MTGRLIYFLRPVGQRGPVKMGCSRLPESRLQTFLPWSPVELEIAATCPGDFALERRLHGLFAAQHLRGEWFSASIELDALIRNIAKGRAVASLIDLKAEVVPFRERPPKSAEVRLRLGYWTRLHNAFDYGRIPEDVRAIMARWAGQRGHERRLPTPNEFARLEEVLAQPGLRARAAKRRRAA